MSAATEERVVTEDQSETKPPIWHAICEVCIPGREPTIGDVFLCGEPVDKDDPMPNDDPPPEERCVVCMGIVFCPVCGELLLG